MIAVGKHFTKDVDTQHRLIPTRFLIPGIIILSVSLMKKFSGILLIFLLKAAQSCLWMDSINSGFSPSNAFVAAHRHT